MNSRCPAMLDAIRAATRPRSWSRSSASSTSSASASRSCCKGAVQNTRPTTEASWTVCLSSGGRRSMRAARTAWTVSGIETSSISATALHRSPSRTICPASMSCAMISSR